MSSCMKTACLEFWDSPCITTHASILTNSMSLLQKVKSAMVNIHLRKLLSVYYLGHARVKGNDWADRPAGKATITTSLCLGRSEVLRSLRHYMRAQSQGHHSINRLVERGVERGSTDDLFWKDKQGPLSIRRTLKLFQKQCQRNFCEMGWSAYGLFQAHGYHLQLNWTTYTTLHKISPAVGEEACS